MEDKQIFDKVISRDWSLIFSQDLHFAYTKLMKKQIGWGYSENIFEGKNGLVSIYRIRDEYSNKLPRNILKLIDQSQNWFSNECKILESQVKSTEDYIKTINKKAIASCSTNELIEIILKLSDLNREFHPLYNTVLWFPIGMEKNPEKNKYAHFIEIAIKTREKVQDIEPKINELYKTIISKLLDISKINPKYWKFVSREDCEKMADGIALDSKKLEQRSKYFIITKKGILNNAINDFIKNEGYFIESVSDTAVDKIMGRSACPGVTVGYAKIVLTKDMFSKVEQGDILIAPMTTADFVEAVQKVSAIVTDEGGITCHAAVISREMNIPCVVGTKNATKVFKDGDFLKVNATDGIVEKIKSPVLSKK